MIVQCKHCGAPLDVGNNDRFATCKYCGTANQVRSMKTIAMQTPPNWQAPQQWQWQAPQGQVVLRLDAQRAHVAPVKVQKQAAGFAVFMIVVTSVLPAVIGVGIALFQEIGPTLARNAFEDQNRAPTGGVILASDGLTSTQTYGGTSGSSVDASTLGDSASRASCRGYLPEAPHFWLQVDAPRHLAIHATNTSNVDLTLVVRGPDGEYLCDDDTGSNQSPLLDRQFVAGRYAVYVGSFAQGTSVPFALRVYDPAVAGAGGALEPSSAGSSGLHQFSTENVRAALDAPQAQFGSFEMGRRLEDDPTVLQGTAGATYDASPLGSDCRGYIDATPSHTLVLSRRETLGVVVHALDPSADAVLVIASPDGTIRCNDDTWSRDPAFFGAFTPGTHLIWVGSYHEGTRFEYALGFTNHRRLRSEAVRLSHDAN